MILSITYDMRSMPSSILINHMVQWCCGMEEEEEKLPEIVPPQRVFPWKKRISLSLSLSPSLSLSLSSMKRKEI